MSEGEGGRVGVLEPVGSWHACDSSPDKEGEEPPEEEELEGPKFFCDLREGEGGRVCMLESVCSGQGEGFPGKSAGDCVVVNSNPAEFRSFSETGPNRGGSEEVPSGEERFIMDNMTFKLSPSKPITAIAEATVDKPVPEEGVDNPFEE